MIVNWSTIDATKKDNFDTLEYDTFNQTYDWKSISHYTNKEYRKQNTLGYTLVAKVSYSCSNGSQKFLNLPIFHCCANLFTETWDFQNHWNRKGQLDVSQRRTETESYVWMSRWMSFIIDSWLPNIWHCLFSIMGNNFQRNYEFSQKCLFLTSSLIFDKCSTLLQTQSRLNHTSIFISMNLLQMPCVIT